MTRENARRLSRLQDNLQLILNGKITNPVLTLSDFYAICSTGKELVKSGYALTFIKNVAEYFAKFDIKVELSEDQVNYKISLE